MRNGKEMKTLRAHGFNQRPRFEQVVGYLERNEPLPLASRAARPPRSSQATSTWTTSCSPARTPTPGLCSTRPCRQFLRTASALPPRPRTRTWARPPSRNVCAGGSGPHRRRSSTGLPLSAAPGRSQVRAPERAAPSGPAAGASADHRPAQ